MRVAFVTGIVTPYTHRLFERLGAELETLHVFACSELEPGRYWTLQEPTAYRRTLMRGLRLHRSQVSHVYANPGIVPALLFSRFDAVMVNDFAPTMMLATLTARLKGLPVVIGTDGQPDTDPGQWSRVHRMARRLIVPRVSLGIGASRGSLEVLERYGLPPEAGIVSLLTPGWDFSGPLPPFEARPYDLLFAGHLDEDRKGALFFADVVAALVARGLRPRVRVAGEGPQREALESRLADLGVEARFDGFLQQDRLAEAYASAKLFLFPSRGDPWGLVANEAIQCGTPQIVSPHARAAQELVEPTGTGTVCTLDVALWAEAAQGYLTDRARWQAAHRRAPAATRTFSLDAMVQAYLGAFARAAGTVRPVACPAP